MRSIIRVCLSSCLLAFVAGTGCGDDEEPGGHAGHGGTGRDAGDAAADASSNGGTSGGTSADGGSDAPERDASDSGTRLDAAAAIATCKAAADGGTCTTCACERCIEYIAECNRDRKCRAILDCAAQSGCRSSLDCYDMCRDVIFAAEDAAFYAFQTGNCREERCAVECAPPDAGSDPPLGDGSPDAEGDPSADAPSVDAAADVSHE